MQLVAKLRDVTGLSSSECRRALERHDGSLNRAYYQLAADGLLQGRGYDFSEIPPPSQIDRSFPRCEVRGAFDPVEFGHMVSVGAVPKKCSECRHLFEGECTRNGPTYMALDHGPCPVTGPTTPTRVSAPREDLLPAKCVECEHLAFDRLWGFHCIADRQIWRDFPRSLDWGDERPPDLGEQ